MQKLGDGFRMIFAQKYINRLLNIWRVQECLIGESIII